MDGFTIGLLGALFGIYLLLKVMIKTKFWKQLTAPGSQKKEDGFTNSFGWETLVNEIGKTDTDLNPSGWVNVEKNRVFVVSEGGFIDKGEKVKILSVDGNRILVRKL
jgi:membrane-bound serine protease (ClpP class)